MLSAFHGWRDLFILSKSWSHTHAFLRSIERRSSHRIIHYNRQISWKLGKVDIRETSTFLMHFHRQTFYPLLWRRCYPIWPHLGNVLYLPWISSNVDNARSETMSYPALTIRLPIPVFSYIHSASKTLMPLSGSAKPRALASITPYLRCALSLGHEWNQAEAPPKKIWRPCKWNSPYPKTLNPLWYPINL